MDAEEEAKESPAPETILPVTPPTVSLLRVMGDAMILFALISIMDFLFATFASSAGFHDTPRFWVLLIVGNWTLLIIGFTASGCLVEAPIRSMHVGLVALGLWFTRLIDIWFAELTITGWILSLPLLGFLALVGTGFAHLIRQDFTRSSES